eukprot:jgi/Hompol1/445/HPOL_003243-RA
MSAQSGIRPSDDFTALFASCSASTTVRAIRANIKDEDFPLLEHWLDERTPSFILFRTDVTGSTGSFEWLLLQYIPDHAKVREKMLYASSKATLLKELGDGNFADSIYGTHKNDLSLEGYRKHLAHKNATAPLTIREQEMAAIKATENTADIGTSTRRANAPGVSFPLATDAESALEDLKQARINTVVLMIDSETESVHADPSGTGHHALDTLASVVTAGAPRFVLHATQDGTKVFAYVSPPVSKVKERMWYSASRGYILAEAERILGTPITKKFEMDEMAELRENLEAEQSQATIAQTTSPGMTKALFAKPARPGRK